jgi:hypothetical protein
MVSEKEFQDRDTGEDILLYSFQIEGDKRYFRTGQDEPTFDEGDAIAFVVDTQKGNKVWLDSVEEIDEEDVQKAPKPRRSSRSAGRKSEGTRTKSGGKSMTKDGYWEAKDEYQKAVVEPRITFAASRKDAVTLVSAALAEDALSFGQAAKGKKLDMLLDMVDQVTLRFYNQGIDAVNTIATLGGTEGGNEYGDE